MEGGFGFVVFNFFVEAIVFCAGYVGRVAYDEVEFGLVESFDERVE